MPVTPRTPRRHRWWWELLVVVWLLWVYDAVSDLAPMRKATALRNGWASWHLERVLHLDPEGTLNHWLAGHLGVGLWVSDYYDNAHFVVTLAVVGWLWWRHQESYGKLRSALVLTNVIGFVVFWVYPMAPPRLVPNAHIVDIVATTHAFGSWHSGTLASAGNANELASMPSLHVAWALWCAWAVWQVLPRRRLSLLVFVYPLLTSYAVLATGNHYLIDAVAGSATLVVAVLLADRLPSLDALWGRASRLVVAVCRLPGQPDAVAGPAVAGPAVARSAVARSAVASSAVTRDASSVIGGFHPPLTTFAHQEVDLTTNQTDLEPRSAPASVVPPTFLNGPWSRPSADLRP